MRALKLALLCCALATAAARADEVEEFYRGKTIQFIIRSAAGGGGYDSYARLLGRHIGRHIPGNPRVLPINMPGGGGIPREMRGLNCAYALAFRYQAAQRLAKNAGEYRLAEFVLAFGQAALRACVKEAGVKHGLHYGARSPAF